MSELILKYNSLDDFGKQELMDFLDFLVLKKKPLATLTKNGYKEKILQVSTWSESEIEEIKIM